MMTPIYRDQTAQSAASKASIQPKAHHPDATLRLGQTLGNASRQTPPASKQSHAGSPRPKGKNPSNNATHAANSANGNCVRT